MRDSSLRFRREGRTEHTDDVTHAATWHYQVAGKKVCLCVLVCACVCLCVRVLVCACVSCTCVRALVCACVRLCARAFLSLSLSLSLWSVTNHGYVAANR